MFRRVILCSFIVLSVILSVSCEKKATSTGQSSSTTPTSSPTVASAETTEPVQNESTTATQSINENNNIGQTITMDNNSIYYLNNLELKVDSQSDNKIRVQISSDNGTSWDPYYITGCQQTPIDYLMGFASNELGWLIINGDVGMGSQNHFIYSTADGGHTWTEVGNTNTVCPKMLSGAGFSEKKIGLLNFIYTDGATGIPVIYQSLDGGLTWNVFELKLPEEYADYTAQALSPTFDGANGTMSIQVTNDKDTKTIDYSSTDYGKTWSLK